MGGRCTEVSTGGTGHMCRMCVGTLFIPWGWGDVRGWAAQAGTKMPTREDERAVIWEDAGGVNDCQCSCEKSPAGCCCAQSDVEREAVGQSPRIPHHHQRRRQLWLPGGSPVHHQDQGHRRRVPHGRLWQEIGSVSCCTLGERDQTQSCSGGWRGVVRGPRTCRCCSI